MHSEVEAMEAQPLADEKAPAPRGKACRAFCKLIKATLSPSKKQVHNERDAQLLWALHTRAWTFASAYTLIRVLEMVTQSGNWFGPKVYCNEVEEIDSPESTIESQTDLECLGDYNKTFDKWSPILIILLQIHTCA